MPAAGRAEDAGTMERKDSRDWEAGRRGLHSARFLRRGGAWARVRSDAGNCPAFYWLRMCVFENMAP